MPVSVGSTFGLRARHWIMNFCLLARKATMAAVSESAFKTTSTSTDVPGGMVPDVGLTVYLSGSTVITLKARYLSALVFSRWNWAVLD